MALTFARTLILPVDTETINAAATFTSLEQDIGDNTIAEQVWLYLEVLGFAAAPAGNERIIVTIGPRHTTAGSNFLDQATPHVFTVIADVAYRFPLPLGSLPRFFVVTVENDTAQNTDANAVSLWIEYMAVTH